MTDQKPTRYYLYVTPWIAFGSVHRPCWLSRVILRVLFGWRWYENERDTLYGVMMGDPIEDGPYTRHLPPAVLLDGDMQVHSTDPTWQMEERQGHPQ